MKKKNLMDVMQVTERIETYGIDSFTDKDLLKMALEDTLTLFSDSLAQSFSSPSLLELKCPRALLRPCR